MARRRSSTETDPSLRLFLDPPSSTGRWGDLSDLDPNWVFLRSQKNLELAEPIDPTSEEMVLASDACEQIPEDLRPKLRDIAHNLYWIEEEGYALIDHTDPEVAVVVAFDPERVQDHILLKDHVVLLRLDSRHQHGTVGLFRNGERLTLPF